MGEQTTISWCDHTFNGWEGCSKVSPGCANCYAETRNHRFGLDNWGKGKPRRRTSAANWKQPLKWNRQAPNDIAWDDHRPRVFCASLADWLDDEVPIEWLADLLKLIHDTPNLDWLLLTKRPENWEARMSAAFGPLILSKTKALIWSDTVSFWLREWRNGKPPQNVWIGVSIEDQKRADERIPLLLQIPAKVRFLSCEPLLGPIQLTSVCGLSFNRNLDHSLARKDGDGIHWVIFGGESGANSRPCNIEWIRDGVRQCRAAGVAPFVKQLGSHPIDEPPGKELAMFAGVQWRRLLRDKKGGDMSEFPEDLRVREFPQ